MSQDTILSPQPTFGRDEFFFPFSEIPYAYFLRGITSKKRTETMQTKSVKYKHCKQNSRDFAKKVLAIKLDPTKDLEKSTRLVRGVPTSGLEMSIRL